MSAPSDQAPRKHSVANGKIIYTSVSQLKTADMCLSKWGFERVLHLPGKVFKAQTDGVEAHARLEAYLLTAVDALGEVERPGKKYLPEPQTGEERMLRDVRVWSERPPGTIERLIREGLLIEHRFDGQPKGAPFNPDTAVLKLGGIPLDGYIDVVNLRMLEHGGLPYPGAERPDPPGTIELLDHKTTSSLAKWAATPEALVDVEHESGHGIQMVGYGEWARLMFGERVKFLRLTHIAYQTGAKRDAKRISILAPVDQILNSWSKLSRLEAEMSSVAKCNDPTQWPRNESACTAYGGCPYLAVCPVSRVGAAVPTQNRFAKETDPMLLDNLLGQTTSTVPTPVASVPTATPAPTPTYDQFVASMPTAVKPGFDPMCNPLQGHRYKIQGHVGTFIASTGGKNSFRFDASPTPVLVPYGVPIEYIGGPVEAPAPAPVAETPALVIPVEEAPAAAEAKKRGPGRPKKAKVEVTVGELNTLAAVGQARVAEEPVTTTIMTVSEETLKAATEVLERAAEPPPAAVTEQVIHVHMQPQARVELFVNCAPGGASNRLEDYIAGLLRNLEAEYQVPDIRLGSGDSPLGFGKWKGVLAACVRSGPPAPGRYTVKTDGEITSAVVEALVPFLRPEDVVFGR